MFATACRTLAADEQQASQVPRTSLAEFAQSATQTGLVPEALAALTGEHTQGKLAIEVC